MSKVQYTSASRTERPFTGRPGPSAGKVRLVGPPAAIRWRNQECFVEWIYTGSRRFTEPFFERTVRACLEHPFTVAFRQESRLDDWDAGELGAGSMRPSGFIFHMSRCGSTLTAQM